MEQSFCPVLLSTNTNDLDWLLSYDYLTGPCLMQHSFVGNKLVEAVEGLLIPGQRYHKCRLVWAGSMASKGILTDNLYFTVTSRISDKLHPKKQDVSGYTFIANHTKHQYVKKGSRGDIHPLPLLTAESNGKGLGDYVVGINRDKVGLWAGDIVSVELEEPNEYTRLDIDFIELR